MGSQSLPKLCSYHLAIHWFNSLEGFVFQLNFSKMVFWEGYLSDEAMDTFAPIVVCWLYAGVHMLLPPQDRYRLHTRKEEEQKNPVPILLVIKGVLLQQFVQATVAQTLFSVSTLSIEFAFAFGNLINSINFLSICL